MASPEGSMILSHPNVRPDLHSCKKQHLFWLSLFPADKKWCISDLCFLFFLCCCCVQFFETVVRYEKFFQQNARHIGDVLVSTVDNRQRLWSLCSYLVSYQVNSFCICFWWFGLTFCLPGYYSMWFIFKAILYVRVCHEFLSFPCMFFVAVCVSWPAWSSAWACQRSQSLLLSIVKTCQGHPVSVT